MSLPGSSSGGLPTLHIYLDFGAAGTTTPSTGTVWNNMTSFADGQSSPPLLDAAGVATGVTFQVGNKSYIGSSGLFTGGQALAVGPYPATAVQDGMRIDSGAPGIEFKINGLSSLYTMGYASVTLRFWGNTADTTTTHRTHIDVLGGTGTYDAAGNTAYSTAAVITAPLVSTTTTGTVTVTTPDADSVLSVLEIIAN